MIPYGLHSLSENDIEAVEKVLESDFLTQGPVVPQFEQAVAQLCGARFGVAVNSGTAALHVACRALGLNCGDTLWTVPNTFVASANCGLYCGAQVDFVDIEPRSWNISVSLLEKQLVYARSVGRLPKIVVPVHFAGLPTEQEAIWELSREFGFKVLEDASHSLGATRDGEPVGSCKWSHVTVFSFHPVKMITTGEGGMALTNDEELAWKMSLLRSHGITRDPLRMERRPEGPWYYEQIELGYNYRMSDIQAALGLSQLRRLVDFTSIRNSLANQYIKRLTDLPLQMQSVSSRNRSSYHLFVVRLLNHSGKKDHRQIFNELRAYGIGVNVHYIPVHLQPYYRRMGFAPGMYPESELHGRSALTLPLYTDLTTEAMDKVVQSVTCACE